MLTDAEIDDFLGLEPAAPVPADDDRIVTAAVLADWLGVAPNTARRYGKDGIVPRDASGGFPLKAAVRAYAAHARAGAVGRTATGELATEKIRLASASARKIELQNLKAEGELIAAAAVRAEWIAVATDLRSRLLAVSQRVAARLSLDRGQSAALDREIRAAMADLASDGAEGTAA